MTWLAPLIVLEDEGGSETTSKTKVGSEKNLSDRLGRIEGILARTIALQEPDSTSSTISDTSSSPAGATGPSTVPSTVPSAAAADPPSDQHTENSPSLGNQFFTHTSTETGYVASPTPSIKYFASPDAGNTTSVSFGQIHYAGCHLGQINCRNGIPSFSKEGQNWIHSRTGVESAFQKLNTFGARQRVVPPTVSPTQLFASSEELYQLPDRYIVEEFLHAFQNSAIRLVFPIVDHVLFKDCIELAYEPYEGPPTLELIGAKASVLAFLSVMSVFRDEMVHLPQVDYDACAVKAHCLLSDILEDTSLTSLQTVFMLHMHQNFSGRLQSATMLHAVACRFVYILGGHSNNYVKPFGAEVNRQERATRHLRMLFWLCYLFDKDISLRTGQPPIMADEFCDLTLPDNYTLHHFSVPSLGDTMLSPQYADESLVPYLPGDLRLSILKHKIFLVLYSAQALRKSDAQLLRDIRELDAELENWRLNVPLDFRPALSISPSFRLFPEMKLPQSMQRIGLHLEYHHLMTTIHRASGRCYVLNAETGAAEGDANFGVQSSMALSLEASRSTLFYLQAAIDGLVGEAFWIIVFYPTAAIMTLFFNVLLHPLDPQAKEDLELLSSAADLVRNMPVRKLTPYEVGHVKLVDDFVDELIRLGNCAIEKEQREKKAQDTRGAHPMSGF
ncbi:hypothetical protein G7046_g3743 [Stylonectria norvegica]|nr:hypothetical protein G7046_g3743 [Stylonectria norvegica]